MTEQELKEIEKSHAPYSQIVTKLIAEIRRLQKERADAPVIHLEWYSETDNANQIVDSWRASHTARLVDIKKI